MKYNNYLVRTSKEGFTLARGHEFLDTQVGGLAIVRLSTAPLEFTGCYSIIDVASGLYVITATSKKKLIQKWKDKIEYYNVEDSIKRSRETDKYLDRVLELNAEKKNWRNSGYDLR